MANLHVIFTGGVLVRHGISAEYGYVSPNVLVADLDAFQGNTTNNKFAGMVAPAGLQARVRARIIQRLLLQPLLQGLQSRRYAVC